MAMGDAEVNGLGQFELAVAIEAVECGEAVCGERNDLDGENAINSRLSDSRFVFFS